MQTSCSERPELKSSTTCASCPSRVASRCGMGKSFAFVDVSQISTYEAEVARKFLECYFAILVKEELFVDPSQLCVSLHVMFLRCHLLFVVSVIGDLLLHHCGMGSIWYVLGSNESLILTCYSWWRSVSSYARSMSARPTLSWSHCRDDWNSGDEHFNSFIFPELCQW